MNNLCIITKVLDLAIMACEGHSTALAAMRELQLQLSTLNGREPMPAEWAAMMARVNEKLGELHGMADPRRFTEPTTQRIMPVDHVAGGSVDGGFGSATSGGHTE